MTGYNDEADTFPQSIDEAMSALLAAGAQHVLWLTLSAVRAPYPDAEPDARGGDGALAPARARRLGKLAASGPNDWFQTDGVHLLEPGGLAMAHLVHAAVMKIVDPLRVVTRAAAPAGEARYIFTLQRGGRSAAVPLVGLRAAGRRSVPSADERGGPREPRCGGRTPRSRSW